MCKPCSNKARPKESYKHKYFRNESFFSRENLSPLSCYWAGFIAADGCINTGRASTTLSIKISNRDYHLLEQFLKDTESTNPILNCTNQNQSRLMLVSSPWVSDLAEVFNIKSRKSCTYTFPDLNNEDLIKAFIVGYIDGNGSICFIGTKKYLKLSLSGTSELLNWIKSYFDKWVAPTRAKKSIQHDIGGTINICEYAIYGERALTLINILKASYGSKMTRKWEKTS